jgi:TraM recognition site of TraD and TraG
VSQPVPCPKAAHAGVDPLVVLVLAGLALLGAPVVVVLGIVLLVGWRVVAARSDLDWRFFAVGGLGLGLAGAVLLLGLAHHDTWGAYRDAEGRFVDVVEVVMLGGRWALDLPAYLRDVLPLALPTSLAAAAMVETWLRSRRARLGRQEPRGLLVPSRVARKAAQGTPVLKEGVAIGYTPAGKLVRLTDVDLRHHGIVSGTPGSGKTTVLLQLLQQVAGRWPVVLLDCKASDALRHAVAALPHGQVFMIGGPLRWDALQGDPTALANKLLAAEEYGYEAAVYRAVAERYVQWIGFLLDAAGEPRQPQRVAELLAPKALAMLARRVGGHHGEAIGQRLGHLSEVEKEGIAGFGARFGALVEGVAAPNLGTGLDALVLERAIEQGEVVLFSLDAASYPHLTAKLGAWVLLDLVRVGGLLHGRGWSQQYQALVIIDEFSELGREGPHVARVVATMREAGLGCVLATQGLADLAQVDRVLPQRVIQDTGIKLVLRQGSNEDAELWARTIGRYRREDLTRQLDGTSDTGRGYARWIRDYEVPPDELRALGTGEAILAREPVGGRRGRSIEPVVLARPK